MKFDVVIIGGGLAGMTAATILQKNGKRCIVVSRGLSLSGADRSAFERLGGTVLAGDAVISGTFGEQCLLSVRTERLGDVELEADVFILATGKFFSCGLVSDMEHVYEPVFGLDVRETPGFSSRANGDFHAPQPFLSFGVISQKGKALRNGLEVHNLYVAGEICEGISGNRETIVKSAEEVSRLILA